MQKKAATEKARQSEAKVAEGYSDDLLAPSLQGRVYTVEPPAKRPWRLGPQFFVAFFGGSLAITLIAFLNAGRLGLSAGRRWSMLGVGLVWGLTGPAVMIHGFMNLEAIGQLFGSGVAPETLLRIVGKAFALLLFGLFYLLQQKPDRAYGYRYARAEEPYASLWVPGLLAIVGFAALQVAIIAFFIGAQREGLL